ncbi:MAG TPA: proteasome subunit alpha [Actinomycetes bacterium]|nr:proteasome subunit alpha [Actinomycetes bacterium]
MAMPFYVSPEQVTKDKADFARKGIARGRPLIVTEYDQGVAFVAENPSTHLHKVGELYDRIAFAGVGRFSEYETLRQAGVRLADIRGYAYGREDVTSRAIANAYSQTLGQVFMQEPKPYEVELCVAELGVEGEPNALYHVSFDGTVVDRKEWLAMGGQVEALNEAMSAAYQEGWKLDAALHAAVEALRTVTPPNGERTRLEIAVLERGPSRRAFRRLSDEDFAEAAADKAPDGA